MASSWRSASISPKALGIPCGAYMPLLACLYVGHSLWIWIVAVLIIVCFGVMAHIGWTLNVCWNKFWASPAADGLWPGRGGIGSVSGIKKTALEAVFSVLQRARGPRSLLA